MDWKVNIDERHRQPIFNSKSGLSAASSKDLQIVHITDTHYDPSYREGANAVCGEPTCCRLKQGNATRLENAAGRWGDYRDCDSPWEAVIDMFETIKANHKVINIARTIFGKFKIQIQFGRTLITYTILEMPLIMASGRQAQPKTLVLF